MAWGYILRTKKGQYYVGSTNDIKRRLKQHSQHHTATTRRLQVEALVLKQEYPSLKDARSVERKIKNLKRRDYIEKMIEARYIKMRP